MKKNGYFSHLFCANKEGLCGSTRVPVNYSSGQSAALTSFGGRGVGFAEYIAVHRTMGKCTLLRYSMNI